MSSNIVGLSELMNMANSGELNEYRLNSKTTSGNLEYSYSNLSGTKITNTSSVRLEELTDYIVGDIKNKKLNPMCLIKPASSMTVYFNVSPNLSNKDKRMSFPAGTISLAAKTIETASGSTIFNWDKYMIKFKSDYSNYYSDNILNIGIMLNLSSSLDITNAEFAGEVLGYNSCARGVPIYKYAVFDEKTVYGFTYFKSFTDGPTYFSGNTNEQFKKYLKDNPALYPVYYGWVLINEQTVSEIEIIPAVTVDDNFSSNQAYLTASNISYTNAYEEDEQLSGIHTNLYNDDYAEMVNHNAIIGLPLSFMNNIDVKIGSSSYGKQFTEDILCDMNIAVIKPGGPVLNNTESNNTLKNIATNVLAAIVKDDVTLLDQIQNAFLSSFTKGYTRFYGHQSDYTHYVQYVNTLCHLFANYIGIGDKLYKSYGSNINATDGSIPESKYINYDDNIPNIEMDKGNSLLQQFGKTPAVFVYYDAASSNISHSLSNETISSSLASKLQEGSDMAKEFAFFQNSMGMNSRITQTDDGLFDVSILKGLATGSGNGLLGQMFANVGEGISCVLSGNNLSLPKLYGSSSTSTTHELKIKLISPYGDPESIFLHILRPLARIMALAFPRQYGPNSYTSPFILQAFSKGQFNCQLGIVNSIRISRGGEGGQSHTINHIPTQLDIDLSIEDMYQDIMLSNEYHDGHLPFLDFIGGNKDLKLLFNNIGLIDFVASYSGWNLNSPQTENMLDTFISFYKNRQSDLITIDSTGRWRFPLWERKINDAINDRVYKIQTGLKT